MCTATWAFGGRPGAWTLDLGFNRDERRTRPPAQPPRRRAAPGGRPFLAPRDPLGGGTWLAVNDAGICVALLNHYEADQAAAAIPPPPGTEAVAPSRGQVVWDLAGLGSVEAIAGRLQAWVADTPPRPFRLLLLQGGARRLALTWRWDGRRLEATDLAEDLPFLSSSAYRGPEVVAGRRELYRAASGEPGGTWSRRDFHRGHRPSRGAWSVCMHRSEARTVSYSQVEVAEGCATLRYAAGSPCRAALGPALSLEIVP